MLPDRLPRITHMQHVSTSLDLFGVWEITILINNVEYVHSIFSEYGYRMFIRHLNGNRFNKAVNVLRRFRIESDLNSY